MIESPSSEPLPACGISPAGVCTNMEYLDLAERRGMAAKPGLLSGTSTNVRRSGKEAFDLDVQGRIDSDGPRPETTGSRDMWQGLSGVVPSAADATIGLACLAMAIAMATAMLGRRKGSHAPTPWIVASLGTLLALCGVMQLARAIAGTPDRIAAPMLAGAACWASALTLRAPGRASVVGG